MNIHKNFESLVEPYLTGGLEPAERKAFDSHVSDCPGCATELADAQEFNAFMSDSLDPLRPPGDLEERLIWALRAEGMGTAKQEGWRRQIRFRLPAWGKVAAMFLLCLGIGIFATQGDRLEYYSAPGEKSVNLVPSGSEGPKPCEDGNGVFPAVSESL